MSTNIAQQNNRVQQLPDEVLQQMLRQMTQGGKDVGTPIYILVAGELQARNDGRLKAMAGKGNKTPVIAGLLTGGAMPMASQVPIAPEDAGGIADLPAPNMDNTQVLTAATGGLVAFDNGGSTMFTHTPLGQNNRGLAQVSPRTPSFLAPGALYFQYMNDEEKEIYQRTGVVPEAAKQRYEKEASEQARRTPTTAPPAAPGAAPRAAPPADGAPTVTRVDKPPAVAPITSPAVPAVDFQNAFTKAHEFAKKLIPDQPTSTTPEPNAKDLIKERLQVFKDLGIEDPTKMRREQLEKEMKEAKSEKKQAGYAWLANFGFTWAATNGPTLQAMGKAGEKTTPGLMSDLKDLNKLDRDRQKELAGLAALDAQAKRATADSVLAEIQRKRERAEDRLDKVEMQRNTIAAALAGNVISAETSLQTTGMTTAASRDVARTTANASLAKLSEQLAETETKNIIDAAKDMVVRRGDYLTMNEQEQRDALLTAIRTIKKGRIAAGPSVTPSGS